MNLSLVQAHSFAVFGTLSVAAVIFDESHSLLALAGAALIRWAAISRSLKFGHNET